MIITLVRHGEVAPQYLACYNGHNDIALSSQGEQEANDLAHFFAHTAFDALYSSDLKRCRQSTAPFLKHLKTKPPYFFTPALREKSWGKHEGMSFDAIVKQDGLKYENFLQWINALDGEDYEAYITRIKDFFTGELPLTNYNKVLVVTHAGVIRVLMHLLQNISLQEAFSVKFPYAAYTTLDTENWTFGEIQCV